MDLLVKIIALLTLLRIDGNVAERRFKINNDDELVPSPYHLDAAESNKHYKRLEKSYKRPNIRFPTSSEERDHDDNDDHYRSYTVGAQFQVGPSADRSNQYRNPGTFDTDKDSYSYSNTQFSPPPPPSPPLYKSKRKDHHSSHSRRQEITAFRPSSLEPISSESEEDETPRPRKNKIHHSDYASSSEYVSFPDKYDQSRRKSRPNYKAKTIGDLYPNEEQFRSVASKGQIQKYLEDQAKYIDEAIKLQLLNDPSPAARGKYHEFLKSKEDERIEKEYEEESKKRPKSTRNPVRQSDRKKPRKLLKPEPGLGSYRTLGQNEGFRINIKI